MSLLELTSLLPVLILALGSTALLMAGAWWPASRSLLLTGVGIALAAALHAALVTPPAAEVAGMFGTGPYARFFTVLWSLAGALTLLLSLRYGPERNFPAGEYASLILFASAGMALLSSATSLVGVFLGLETFTLVFYILIAFHKESPDGAEAGLKYLVMGAVATGFLAFGIALIYAVSGTFHIPEAMAGLVADGRLRPLGLAGWAMLVVALGFKISLVPFHLWTPDVYQGAPAPVTGILAAGSKGATVAALVPLLSGPLTGGDLTPLLWLLSALTMLVGTLCALRQENLKRMLGYSSVVHMGYVLIGLIASGEIGESAVLFYLVSYTAATLGAFGTIASLSGPEGEPQDLSALRGLGYRHPYRAGALAVFLFSLAGIPPAAGFIGKFGIFYAAVKTGYVGLAILGALASLVSVAYYLRPVMAMFMTEEKGPEVPAGNSAEHTALAACLAATLLLGILPGPLLDLIALVLP
ncbi:NADH-quinone oxidoreductase subunit N [Desulfuromonas sp.]|uniref:NADH-quinone oxidoreductase subunit N n=1 Tax=Desulfuromonas sp. TaxID=892 RepID=UPI0025B7B919|nr:NADH-quinone oxidoreductase subunit N [Desulfuromonas sp.]